MPKDNGASATRVVTCPVRLSYAHIFEPHTNDPEESAPRYSTTILIPKNTPEGRKTIREIEAGFDAAAEAGKHTKFGGRIPGNLARTMYDADDPSQCDLEKNPEYAGHMFMAISSKTAPGVVDKNVKPILDSTQIYSGCWCRIDMNAFPYAGKKKGVSFGLNHVQKIRDDDFLGGRSRAEDVFSEYEDDSDEYEGGGSAFSADDEDLLGI